LDHADQLVCKVLELIDYFQPKWWWIENPATGMLKDRPYMAGLQYVDIDYCQFSHWGYRKPTRFWGKLPGGAVKDVVCDGYHCPNLAGKPSRVGGPRRHRVQLSSWRSSPSTTSQYRIPPALIKYLVGSLPNPQEPEPAKAPPHPLSVRVSHPGQAHPAEVTGIGACGGNQLTLRILAQDGAGNLEWINALVDTGAQANLLSSSRFGGGNWRDSSRPLSLLTVTGEPLGGGNKEISLGLTFGVQGVASGSHRESSTAPTFTSTPSCRTPG
jgi:hypothetical protein